MTLLLTHLRRNVVAYVALLVAMTGTSYAAVAVANGSITTAKLHTNAVTSKKIKNGTIKAKDIRKPTYVQSTTRGNATPTAVPDVLVAPYDFSLPHKGRTLVTVFVPALTGDCGGGGNGQPDVGLYLDNVPVPGTQTLVPNQANARALELTTTLELTAGGHAARLGITCNGAPVPDLASPGAESWSVIQAG